MSNTKSKSEQRRRAIQSEAAAKPRATKPRRVYPVTVPPQDGKPGYVKNFDTSREAQAFVASLSADKPTKEETKDA